MSRPSKNGWTKNGKTNPVRWIFLNLKFKACGLRGIAQPLLVTNNLRTVLREHPRRSAMACWVSPAWRHLRARCWRLSVAQSRMTIGNRINAATQAAMQVIDIAGNALVRQPGRSGLTD